MTPWWGRRRPAAPKAAGGAGAVGPVDRLRVDGHVVPVHVAFEPFQADVRAGRLALFRIPFSVFSAPTPRDPLFRLAESDVGNVTELTTLCCLNCGARHSVNGIYARSLLGKPPLPGCQRCGSPDGVLLYDPAAAGRPDQPYDLARVEDAGTRIAWVGILHPDREPTPDVLRQILDLAGHGASFEGARIVTRRLPPDRGSRPDAEDLGLALLAAAVDEQALAGSLERARLVWLRFPAYGDLLVIVLPEGG